MVARTTISVYTYLQIKLFMQALGYLLAQGHKFCGGRSGFYILTFVM